NRRASSGTSGAVWPDPEVVGARGHRLDHNLEVLVEVETRLGAQLVCARLYVLAADGGGEARLLQLLLDRLRLEPVDALGADVRAGGDEAGELVAGEERLVEQRLP